MGSTIEWTNKTWNPTTGCTPYSSAKNGGNECLCCYAEKETKRLKAMGQEKYKEGFDVFVEHENVLNEPYTWKQPSVVFVNSMSDLLHKDCSDDFIRKVFKVMNDTPEHTYQILTKRNDRLVKLPDDLEWSKNIWMGVSCGNQYATRKRIPALVESKAKHKFLSIEPFIQEISQIDLIGINWVIVGGESGNDSFKIEKDDKGQDKYEIIDGKVTYTHELDSNGNKILEKEIRPMKKEWVEIIKNKCEEKGIPFFFKQWGKVKNNPNPNDPTLNKEHRYYAKGGCQLNGEIYWANPTMENHSTPMINVFGEDLYVMDEYEDLNTIWELKSHLPMMEKMLYSQLKENIRQNDLNDPILYYVTPEGKKLVIEGHTRLKACIELKKITIPTKEVKENFSNLDDIKLWMVKHQCQRRNLSSVEKIKLAFLSKETIERMAKINLSKAGKANSKKTTGDANTEEIITIDTHAEIAKIAGVGRTNVVKYLKILAKASEAIKDQLNNGSITIGKAHTLLKKEETTIENSGQKSVSNPPASNNSQKVADRINNDYTLIESTDESLKNEKEVVKEEMLSVIEAEQLITIQIDKVIKLQNIEEGEQKLLNGEIDVVMIFNQIDELNILKENPNVRIGVYYLK